MLACLWRGENTASATGVKNQRKRNCVDSGDLRAPFSVRLALAGVTDERSGHPAYSSHSEIVQARVHRYFLDIIHSYSEEQFTGKHTCWAFLPQLRKDGVSFSGQPR